MRRRPRGKSILRRPPGVCERTSPSIIPGRKASSGGLYRTECDPPSGTRRIASPTVWPSERLRGRLCAIEEGCSRCCMLVERVWGPCPYHLTAQHSMPGIANERVALIEYNCHRLEAYMVLFMTCWLISIASSRFWCNARGFTCIAVPCRSMLRSVPAIPHHACAFWRTHASGKSV